MEGVEVFHFDDGHSYRMPAHFGGVPGAGLHNLQYDDVTQLAITYATEVGELARYVPDAFEILAPEVTITYQKCMGVQWMGGSGYSLISVSTSARHLRSGTDGEFILVIWENKTAPILGGREETGMPKVFADIPDHRLLQGQVTVDACHEGRVFLEMEADLGPEVGAEGLAEFNAAGRVDQLGWRYLPQVGRPGAALSHATLYPVDCTFRSARGGTGAVRWTTAEPAFHPLQWHIINALADLPVVEYRSCVYATLVTNLRGDLARELA